MNEVTLNFWFGGYGKYQHPCVWYKWSDQKTSEYYFTGKDYAEDTLQSMQKKFDLCKKHDVKIVYGKPD